MAESRHETLGFDPGSTQWRLSLVNDQEILKTWKINTDEVVSNPELALEPVKDHSINLEAIAAPSGFGLPTTTLQELDPKDIKLMTLNLDDNAVVGLRKILDRLRSMVIDLNIPCFILPSVKHLPTVPDYRKISRIDMGTSDKVCSAAHALQSLADEKSAGYRDVTFILAEIGHAFASLVCISKGEIVDGIGGTNARFGTRACGALDAELAHIWHFPDKSSIYSGGLTHAAGIEIGELRKQMYAGGSKRIQNAVLMFRESFQSDLAALSTRNEVKDFVLSSCLGARMNEDLSTAARDIGLEEISGLRNRISASHGAALLANGLIGGGYKDLTSSLQIAAARGSLLDELYFGGKAKIS